MGWAVFSVKHNIDQVLSFTDKLSKQYEFAVASALTQTAMDMRVELYREQERKFDRPTRYTKNSMFVVKATKTKLQAEVLLKDRLRSGTSRSHVDTIGHEYSGGKRRQKAIEYFAVRAGLLSNNEILVPSEGARLDAYGNMSRGQVQQVMSQLRLGADPATYATKSARSKRNQRRAGTMFWSYGGHLPRGVWMRSSISVIPVLMAEPSPTYRALINVPAIGNRVTQAKFEANLRKAWARAKATAR